MRTESPPTSARTQPPQPTLQAAAASADDPLSEIDDLIQNKRSEQAQAAQKTARLQADRYDFAAGFTTVCDQHVRPAMETILERLRRNGGGGLIEERPENSTQHHTHRITLWMSFSGEIAGAPRQDRNPYLQLDAEVDRQSVAVSEGDMWQGHGGNRSGKVAEWHLAEITADRVTQELLAVIRRALK